MANNILLYVDELNSIERLRDGVCAGNSTELQGTKESAHNEEGQDS